MHLITNFTVRLIGRWLPDAFILAIALTLIVFVAGLVFTGQSVLEMGRYWGQGFSSLFTFGMQMTLVLVTGYVLALSPPVHRILDRITDLPNSPSQALGITAAVSFVCCYFNWGFGLVVGAILAREMGRKVPGLHFPLVVAAAYGGELVRGPSSSIPVVMATPDNFMLEITGRLIPVSETLYSGWNIALTLVMFVALIVLYIAMRPDPEHVREFRPEPEVEREEADPATWSPAERIEHARWVNWLLALMPALYFIALIESGEFSVTLNTVILFFLLLALLTHRSPIALLDAVGKAIYATRGIVWQFPIYAGVSGMMAGSGLVVLVSGWFTSIATPTTFPLLTFLSAGLVNIFIPSGGGQWAVQGPIAIEAAQALGADIAQTTMAFAWGDAWTNQIQPFWALPLLGVAGLTARDIMGYCLIWFLISGILIGGTLVLLTIFDPIGGI